MSSKKRPSGYTPIGPPSTVVAGYVALIDVLGFRELVGRDEQLSEVQEYVRAVGKLLDGDKHRDIQFVLFSDNLVINTLDDKESSFLALVRTCSALLFNLAQRHIAVRGAIAYGGFMRSPNTQQGVIVAGRPIVEAEYYQHLQDWVGIMLAPSVVRKDYEYLQKEGGSFPTRKRGETEKDWLGRISLPFYVKRWAKIPFHAEGSKSTYFAGFAVLPIPPEVAAFNDVIRSLASTLKHLGIMKAAAPNPAAQDKYSASIKFLQSARADWAVPTTGQTS